MVDVRAASGLPARNVGKVAKVGSRTFRVEGGRRGKEVVSVRGGGYESVKDDSEPLYVVSVGGKTYRTNNPKFVPEGVDASRVRVVQAGTGAVIKEAVPKKVESVVRRVGDDKRFPVERFSEFEKEKGDDKRFPVERLNEEGSAGFVSGVGRSSVGRSGVGRTRSFESLENDRSSSSVGRVEAVSQEKKREGAVSIAANFMRVFGFNKRSGKKVATKGFEALERVPGGKSVLERFTYRRSNEFLSGFSNRYNRGRTDISTRPFAEQFGQVGGIVGDVALVSARSSEVAGNVLGRVKGSVGRFTEIVGGTPKGKLGQFAWQGGKIFSGIGAGVAENEALSRFTKGFVVPKTFSEEEAQVVERSGGVKVLKEDVGKGFGEVSRRAEGNLASSILNQISPFQNKAAFRLELERSARSRGLRGADVDAYVSAGMKERTGVLVSEPVSLINMGRISERIGRPFVAEGFERRAGQAISKSKSFGKVFSITAPEIGKAGFVEGVTTVEAQRAMREQSQSVKERVVGASVGGLAGFASAGLLGGIIAGGAASGSKVGKVTNLFANVLDPFEKPGDIAADIQEAGLRRFGFRGLVRTPSITVSGGKSEGVVSFGGGKGRGGSVASFVQGRGKSVVPSPADIVEGKGTIPTGTPVDTPTDTPTDTTPTNINEIVKENVNNFEMNMNVNFPTNTPVDTFTSTNVPIPVVTPLGRLPIVPPLSFPTGGGGVGSGVGRGKRYVSELVLGKSFLAQSLGIPKLSSKVKSSNKGRKVKSSKKGRKGRRGGGSYFDNFVKVAFG